MQSHWRRCGGAYLGIDATARCVSATRIVTASATKMIVFKVTSKSGNTGLGPSGTSPPRKGAARNQRITSGWDAEGRLRAALTLVGRILPDVTAAVEELDYQQAEYEMALRALRLARCYEHPAFFLQFVHCVDAKTGEDFDFDLLYDDERVALDLDGPAGKWIWHRGVLDSWIEQEVSLEYKARQIGVTWLAS